MTRLYATTFGLTLLNPSTILSFVALFAGLGLGAADDGPNAPAAMVLGVFVGSALWWLLVTGGISAARTRLSQRLQRGVNVGSGLVLMAFGLAALSSVLAG